MDFRILVDGGGDFREDFLKENNIYFMPIMVSDGEREIDPKDLDRDEFFSNMKKGKVYTTSQVSMALVKETFEYFAKEKERVLYYGFSSGLSSGTPNAKILAEEVKKDYPDFDILVWDSLNVTMAEEMVLRELLKKKDSFGNWKEVGDYLDFLRKHLHVYYTVGNMEYLFRGGRLSRGSYLVGSALQIKPFGILDEAGKLAIKEKVRGYKNLYQRMAKNILEKRAGNSPLYLARGEDDSMIECLSRELDKQAGKHIEYEHFLVGPVICSHTGPEVLEVCYFDEDMDN